jgi:O-antigen/teichoic acid export membrane protein
MALFSSIKQLSRHSFVYTIATMIQRLQGLVLLPIYTDTAYVASKAAYGDYALVYTFIAFMNVVYLYGMDSAFLRYYFLGKQKKENLIFTSFFLLIFSSLVLSFFLFFFADSIAKVVFTQTGYAFFIKMAAGILLFDTLANIPFLILRAEEKSVLYTSVRIGRFLLELCLNLYFVLYLKWGVPGILYANLTAAVITFIILSPFLMPYFSGKFRLNQVRDLLAFGLPMLPNGLAFLIVEVSDRFLMPRLLDKDILGIYSANYKLGTVMLLLVSAFRTAWQPYFLKIAGETQAREVYARVLTYFVLISAMVVISGTFFVEYIVRIPIWPGKTLVGSAYWEGIYIIPLILLSYFFYGMYVNFTVGIYIRKKSHLMVIFTGLAGLVNVGSNLYLMPALGMLGAGIATLLAYFVMMASIFLVNQRIYPITYEYGRVGVILIGMLMILMLSYAVPMTFMVKFAIVVAIPVFLLLSNYFNPDEKVYVASVFRKALHRS